jgi:uncharacterized membrane protein
MSAAPILFVLLMLAMGAVLIVVFFVMPFFAFDRDGEIRTRRPQSRTGSGRGAKRTRKKSQNFLKRRPSKA